MNSELSTGKKILIWTGTGLALCLSAAGWSGAFKAETAAAAYGKLSDACFLTAVLLAGIGGLSYMASEGFYDIMGYGVKTVWNLFRTGKPLGDFGDYKEEKAKERRPWKKEALFVGLAFLLLSGIFFLLYRIA